MDILGQILLWSLPVLLAITLHEAAHGYVAKRCGDHTAFAQGRVTLNPLKHIDPVGTVVVPLIMLVLSSGDFLFGWAKPVPVNFNQLRKPRLHMIWVAAAGPAANALMGLAWALVLLIPALFPGFDLAEPMRMMAQRGVVINAVFMVLNLLPLPPLDGGRIVTGLLPPRLAWQFARIEPYGMIIIIALLMSKVLTPFMTAAVAVASSVFMLPAALLGKLIL